LTEKTHEVTAPAPAGDGNLKESKVSVFWLWNFG